MKMTWSCCEWSCFMLDHILFKAISFKQIEALELHAQLMDRIISSLTIYYLLNQHFKQNKRRAPQTFTPCLEIY